MHIKEIACDEQGRNAQKLEDSVPNFAALAVLARRELGICDEIALFFAKQPRLGSPRARRSSLDKGSGAQWPACMTCTCSPRVAA